MATAIARGPLRILLQNSAGQYVLLGMGAYILFPEKFQKVLEYSPSLMKLVDISGSGSGSGRGDRQNVSPSPIIIHTPSPTIIGGNGSKTWMGTIAYTAAGATACWAGYVVAVQLLPDTIGQFLPVTRTIFDKTSQSLGKGILRCKEVLEEKILILSGQQDELGKKQDATNRNVSHIKSELGEARIDLTLLQSSMDRCEGSLEKTEGMQQFTLRGVRLLVRCVANMLPDNPETANELARFIEEERRQLLEISNQEKSGLAPGENDDVPIIATAMTPATPIYTPSITRRQSSSVRRSSDISTTRKSLPLDEHTQDEFQDIRALLGH